MNILFVCTGNISRSFLAEVLLKNEIERLKAEEISVSSAGLSAFPGSPPDSHMVDYLLTVGIPAKDHEARQVTKQDVEWADLILVMERQHEFMMKRLWPSAGGRIKRLGGFISEDKNTDDVVDPFGKSPYHYRLAQAQITLAIKNLLKSIL